MAKRVYVAACSVGRGVFAGKSFQPGERILGFWGPHVDHLDPIHCTPKAGNLLQIGLNRYIYPRPRGLFVNHSCNPNAGLRGTVTLVALRPISVGEEIRFDYSTTMDDQLWTMDCSCGEASCRSLIGDFRDLPEELRLRYIDMGIVPRFIAKQWSRSTMPAGSGNGNGGTPRALSTTRQK